MRQGGGSEKTAATTAISARFVSGILLLVIRAQIAWWSDQYLTSLSWYDQYLTNQSFS
jgi:hypothetical protein